MMFKVGDTVYYDDDSGVVKELKVVTRPYSQERGTDVLVKFENGAEEWCWASDLVSEKDYNE